jgi:hypothetical protein
MSLLIGLPQKVSRVCAVATAVGALAVVQPAYGAHGESEGGARYPAVPEVENLGQSLAPVRDRVVRDPTAFERFARRLDPYCKDYEVAGGELVTICLSDYYVPTDAALQGWANFMASLVHGAELGSVVVNIVSPAELTQFCGADALACYSPEHIVVPGRSSPGAPIEEVTAHEYGHHVAWNRSNAPWAAIDWGTKRWATYERICRRVRAGEYFPGNEGQFYTLNPGEGFAEVYRVLNDDATGGTLGWVVVDDAFIPDRISLSLARRDVLRPWSGPSRRTWRPRFSSGLRRFARSVSTPLDGTFRATLRGRRQARLLLLSESGRLLRRSIARPGAPARIRFTVCGNDSLRVVARGSRGRFSLAVSKP